MILIFVTSITRDKKWEKDMAAYSIYLGATWWTTKENRSWSLLGGGGGHKPNTAEIDDAAKIEIQIKY